jgi:hypothetical protein
VVTQCVQAHRSIYERRGSTAARTCRRLGDR